MKSIEELNQYFRNNGVSQEELEECALRIHAYMESILESYNINIDKNHHEEISEKVYLTLLNHIDESSRDTSESSKTARNVKSVFNGVLEDLREGGESGTGSIMFLIGKSGINEETRHNTLTLIASLISRELDESDIDLNKELDSNYDDFISGGNKS